jgi:predicted AAA+ superfamily ATPase
MANKDREEHQSVGGLNMAAIRTNVSQVKEQLKKYQKLKFGDPGFYSLLKHSWKTWLNISKRRRSMICPP